MNSGEPYPDITEALEDLAFASERKPSYGIIGSRFIRDLNAYKEQERKAGVLKHKRPESTRLLQCVLENLGIRSPTLEPFLATQARELAMQTKGMSLAEQRQYIGTDIHPNSPLRFAFMELDQALSDFHGSLYDGELAHARLLGDFVVEHALQSVAERLRPPA